MGFFCFTSCLSFNRIHAEHTIILGAQVTIWGVVGSRRQCWTVLFEEVHMKYMYWMAIRMGWWKQRPTRVLGWTCGHSEHVACVFAETSIYRYSPPFWAAWHRWYPTHKCDFMIDFPCDYWCAYNCIRWHNGTLVLICVSYAHIQSWTQSAPSEYNKSSTPLPGRGLCVEAAAPLWLWTGARTLDCGATAISCCFGSYSWREVKLDIP